jgi:hypothetical protein
LWLCQKRIFGIGSSRMLAGLESWRSLSDDAAADAFAPSHSVGCERCRLEHPELTLFSISCARCLTISEGQFM